MEFLLECSICKELFKDPRCLQCGHTFCLECLQGKYDARSAYSNLRIICPLDRLATAIPPGGLHAFPKNHVVNNALESVNKVTTDIAFLLEMMECKDSQTSNFQIQHGKGEYFCFTCKSPLCASCIEKHTTKEEHFVMSKEELSRCAKTSKYAFDEQDRANIQTIKNSEQWLIARKQMLNSQAIDTETKRHHYETEIMQTEKTINKIVDEQQQKIRKQCEQLLLKLDECRRGALGVLKRNTKSEIRSFRQSQLDIDKQLKDIQEKISLHEAALGHSSSSSTRSNFVKKNALIQQTDSEVDDKVLYCSEINVDNWCSKIYNWIQKLTVAWQAASDVPKMNNDDIRITFTPSPIPPFQLAESRAHSQTTQQAYVIKDIEALDLNQRRFVDILDMQNEQLLISQSEAKELFVYKYDGSLINKVKVENPLKDAVWTRNGNIVCTTYARSVLLLNAESEVMLTMTDQFQRPECLSRSTDGTLHLADVLQGIFQSEDGINWNRVCKFPDDGNCFQVIKVDSNNRECFWTIIETFDNQGQGNHLDSRARTYRVCSYSLQQHDDGSKKIKWRNISLRTPEGANIEVGPRSKLMYDGKMNIFLSDELNSSIHVFSPRGQYQRKLSLPFNVVDKPGKLAIDGYCQMMSIGQKGKIKLLQLKQDFEDL